MDLEGKESSESGSPVKIESPPPVSSGSEGMVVPEIISAEKVTAATVEGGGGDYGGGGNGDLGMLSGSGGTKKRGRPRKYDPEGNLSVPYMATATTPPGSTLTSPTSPPHFSSSSSKRGRGRPPGSGNWQLLACLGELFIFFKNNKPYMHFSFSFFFCLFRLLYCAIGRVCVICVWGS